MNHKYNRQQPQRQPQQIRSTFLPKLCSSSSTKDQVKLSHRRCSSLSNEDPTSPRVGCMGQVKRNNKVIGFPTIISFSSTPISKTDQNITNSTISHVKYHKLKKLFSTKSLFNVASPTLVRATNVARTKERRLDHSRKSSRSKIYGNSNSDDNSGNTQKGCLVNLEELDPPLPVIKKINKQVEDEEEINKGESLSLWKRRSGGVPLKSLQVQVIHNQGHSVFSS